MLRRPSECSTVTVPRPATVPRCVTVPGATASTPSPGRAARSRPRCPAAHGLGGARKRRRTGGSGRERPVPPRRRAPGRPPDRGTDPETPSDSDPAAADPADPGPEARGATAAGTPAPAPPRAAGSAPPRTRRARSPAGVGSAPAVTAASRTPADPAITANRAGHTDRRRRRHHPRPGHAPTLAHHPTRGHEAEHLWTSRPRRAACGRRARLSRRGQPAGGTPRRGPRLLAEGEPHQRAGCVDVVVEDRDRHPHDPGPRRQLVAEGSASSAPSGAASAMTKYVPLRHRHLHPGGTQPRHQPVALGLQRRRRARRTRRRRGRAPVATACWNGPDPTNVRNCFTARTAATAAAGPGHPADLPAGGGERLAGRRDRQGALAHPRQRRDRHVLDAVERQVLVDLVGDDPGVVLPGQRADQVELGPREDLARRVVRSVEQHQPRPRRERRPQRLLVDREVGEAQHRRAPHAAGEGDRRRVRVVVGLEGHDLVARLAPAPGSSRRSPPSRPPSRAPRTAGRPTARRTATGAPRPHRAARARPGPGGYWLRPPRMAATAASSTSGGPSVSGKPCPRLIAPCSAASADIVAKIVVPKGARAGWPGARQARAACPQCSLRRAVARLVCLVGVGDVSELAPHERQGDGRTRRRRTRTAPSAPSGRRAARRAPAR